MQRKYLILSALFFAAFASLGLGLTRYPGIGPDPLLHDAAGRLNAPFWISFNRFITVFGEGYFIYFLSAFVSALLFYRRYFREGIWYLAAVIAGLQVNYGFKLLFARRRPEFFDGTFHLSSYAYPSGHAFGSLVFYAMTYGILIRLDLVKRTRKTDIAVGLLITLISLSRIFLGVHWGTDVVGGLLLGASWICLSLAILERLHAKI